MEIIATPASVAAPAAPVASPVASSSSSSSSSASSIKAWLVENKMAVVASAAAATIGGVAYYAYRKSTSGKNASTSSSPKKSSSSKSSKAKKSAGKKQESEDDAFLAASSRNEVVSTESMLDEQTGAEAVAVKHVTSDDDASADNTVAIGEAAADAAAAATDVDVSASQEFKDTPMDDAKREELALAAKNRGNKYYAEKKYQKAIEFYTKGISFYPTADPRAAVLYSNRAACHANLHNYQAVVDDCTKALDADPKYSKALLRRATALEKLEGREVEALHDYTCVALLEQFQNAPAMDAADRLLRTVAKREAEELFKGPRKAELPSLSFISAYLSSYRYVYLTNAQLGQPTLPSTDSGDKLFIKAVRAFANKNWEAAFEHVTKAVEESPVMYAAEALNMLGTFQFLMGDMDAAEKSIQRSMELKPEYVNSYIKMASVLMEKNQEQETFERTLKLFDEAEQHGPKDPDVFYHRGQIYFLMQDYRKAMAEYERSTTLDANFLFAKIQHAVACYRLGEIATANDAFDVLVSAHGDAADVHYFYGEILLDQGKVEEAQKAFERASRINPSLALPLLNRGIIAFHVNRDIATAMDLTTKAIAADNRCEIAYLHLAQMFAQSGRLAEAMGTYTRAIDLSRSASDAEAACLGMQAVRAQMAAMQRLGPVMGVPAEAMAEANAAAAATAAAAAESSVAAAGAQ